MRTEWLTINDVKEIYGISPSMQSKLRMASSNSEFPFYKMGQKAIRYDRAEIDNWIRTNPANTRRPLTDKERIQKTTNSLLHIYGDIE
jgi:predicted DNA-binding transcriptional regulator AlpA